MRPHFKLLTALAFAAVRSVVAAQTNLGELLDAGAQKLSAEEFRRDVVQRTFVGPTAGGTIEIMYVGNGSIVGLGSVMTAQTQVSLNTPFSGEWTIDDAGWVCATMRVQGTGAFVAGGGGSTVLPRRCQAWFKLGDVYFISDSDSDRRAKILQRRIKPAFATPSNLDQLLVAGAIKLSAAEFRRDVVQRTIVGPLPTGVGEMEFTYVANGSIRGRGNSAGSAQWLYTVSGDWTVADDVKVCTTMQIRGPVAPDPLPQRCQFWFKLGDDYYTADSDSDRDAKVLRRTVRP